MCVFQSDVNAYLEGVACPEVDGHECQPDDAGGVHGEADELGLVEVLWDLPRLDGVHGADGDQQHVVNQRHQEGRVAYTAFEDHLQNVVVETWMSLYFEGFLYIILN